MNGLFGGLFDFNNNGKFDTFEQAAEFATFSSIMDADEAEKQKTELEISGLHIDELEFMNFKERREALEDAGLDPDDYDF